MDTMKKDAKQALVDKETVLELIQDSTSLSKVEIRVEIALLQKIWAWLSASRVDSVLQIIVLGRASCPLSGD